MTVDCLVHSQMKVARIYQFDQGWLNIQSCFVTIDHVRSWKEAFNYIGIFWKIRGYLKKSL